MAQHELLVKLGLQSDSFTRNLKNVNNQLKMTEAELKKAESATQNFDKSQNGLKTRLDSLRNTQELLTAKTTLYKNKITELKGTIAQNAEAHTKLGNKLTEEKRKLAELEATHGKTSKAYKTQKKVVNDLQTEYDKSKKKIENMNLSLQRHQTELLKTETNLNKVQRSIREVNFDRMTVGLQNMSNNLLTFSSRCDAISKKLGSLGRTMSMGITLPAVGMGRAIVKTGSEFEASMSKVGALSRATGDDFKQLENKAREMGEATSFTAKDSADALGYMALAGWDTHEMLVGIEPVLRAAEAGGTDLATTSDLVTDSMATLGLQADDLGGYLDVVARASATSNTEMDQMLRAYIQAGGAMSRFNIPLAESGALIGILANRGMKAEQAGRSFSSIMINLIKPTGESAKALKELNISAYDSQGKFKGVEKVLLELHNELNKTENGVAKYTDKQKDMFLSMIGGKTQIRTLDALLAGVADTTANGSTEFQNLKKELENCDGALEDMAFTMKDNLQGDWEKFTSALDDVALTIYDLVQPALREFVQWLTGLAEKFKALSPETQMFIVKTVAMAAAAGPLILVLAGVFKVLSIVTGGIGGAIKGFLSFGKTMGNVLGLVKGGMSVWGALGTTIAGFPAIVAGFVLAIWGIIAALGENENWLARIQEKYKTFGTVISGVCEFLAGVFQLTIGNIIILLGTLGKVMIKAITLQWDEIDDVIREGGSKIAQNSEKAFDNMAMQSTQAISRMRDMTSTELRGLTTDMELILKELPNLTYDNAGQMANKFADGLKDLDYKSISILSSTSDTMNMLFRNISEGMDNKDAVAQYTSNLQSLARTGGVSADELKSEIERTLNLINNNMKDSGDRFAREAEGVWDKFKAVSSQGVKEAAGDIAKHITTLDISTLRGLQNMGQNWGNIFRNLKLDGTVPVEEMTNQIETNIRKMANENPKYIENLQKEMKTHFDKMPKDAQDNLLKLTEEVSKGSDGAVNASAGKGQKINENLKIDTTQQTQEELNNTQQAINNSTNPMGQSAKNVAEGAKNAFGEGLNGMDTVTNNKMAEQAQNMLNGGEGVKQAMGNNANSSVDGFTQSWDANSGRINQSVNSTFDNINRLTLLKWGNTTQGLSQVAMWLGTVSGKAASTKNAMTPLTAMRWGNTTQGLSQVSSWLSRVTSGANQTKGAMTPLTAMRWGNTTKGLSEVVKWLRNVTTASKQTENALKAVTRVTFGSITKGLSEVVKWLNNVKSSANTAKSYLQSLASVRFGGVTKGLSEVNRWLGIVKSSAGSTRSALSSVAAARAAVPKSISAEPKMIARALQANADENKIAILSNMPDINAYATNVGNLNQARGIESGIANVYSQGKAVAEEAMSGTLVQMLMQQNQMLMQILGSDRDIVLNNNMIVDGKVLAKTTVRHTENILSERERRKNRLGGNL